MRIVAAKWAVCAVVAAGRSLPVIAALAAVSAVFLFASLPFAVAQTDTSPIIGASLVHRAPSLDMTVQKLRVGQETYGIPRNYIFAIEEHPSGMPAAISMRAMLPDMSPMTQATRLCFIDVRAPCNSEIVIFGLTRDRWPVTASSQIRNANNLHLWKPGKRVGPCGLEYFEDNAPTERTGQGFNYFIRSAPGPVDLPLLSCPKDNATAYRPLCNSHENLDDTNSFYYTFNRSRICEWPEISQKIIGLFRRFREQGTRQ